MFQREIQGRLHIYRSSLLQSQRGNGLIHGFSSRMGGYSTGVYQSLNLGWNSGDQPMDVRQNRILFATTLGIGPERVVCGQQVHSTRIARVGKQEAGRGFLDPMTALPETDGLVTGEAGVALMTLYADCVPVLFYEPEQKTIAVCHCGWRGTVGKLAAQMVDVMEKEYHCDPEKLLIAIGPSISRTAYEVDQPVLEKVCEAFSFAEQCITHTDKTHGKLDLWELNRIQLMEKGVPRGQIELSECCTYQRKDVFFSHRASNGKTGRNGAMLMLL